MRPCCDRCQRQYDREPHTTIGNSEHPGGETTYCSAAGRTSPDQGQLSDNFWRNMEYKEDNGINGKPYVQRKSDSQVYIQILSAVSVTGCINPETLDRLDPNDDGGQYDSNGGADGQGNPQGSMCIGCVEHQLSSAYSDPGLQI